MARVPAAKLPAQPLALASTAQRLLMMRPAWVGSGVPAPPCTLYLGAIDMPAQRVGTPVEGIGGPWGGSVSFNYTSNWYFDSNTSTTESFSGFDFYSVAVHEIAHVLGMGHLPTGTMSDVNGVAQEVAMDPDIAAGQRKYMTTADYNGMQGAGWQVTAVPEPATMLLWSAGLGLFGLRRRGVRAQAQKA